MGRPVKRRVDPERRYQRLLGCLKARMQLDAERAVATRRLCSFNYVRGDLHLHTTYSDGSGTVADAVDIADARGLDFIFVTDHGTVRQKVECRRYPNIWWGQEPGGGPHHICILDIDRKFTPKKDIARDAERLRQMGAFFFFPHPTGWFPRTYYSREQIESLAAAGREFAIEVMNGIFRVDSFHDDWTDMNAALWDRYLGAGYRVTGLAATDAHFAAGVGNVWTGCVGVRARKESVLRALRRGNVFASAGPAINLTCGKAGMGDEVRRHGRVRKVILECADACGLAWARIIADGKVVKSLSLQGAMHMREPVSVRVAPGSYVRAECAAIDDRRAFANPLYFP